MTPQLTPSALLYLFCHRAIAPQPKRSLRRVKPPCGEPEVNLTELARTSLAISFWSLRERGVVRLERFQKERVLRGPTERVRVVVEAPHQGTPATLEEALAVRAAGEQNFEDIGGMIARSNYNAVDPWLNVVSLGWNECAAAGIGEVNVPPLRKRILGASPHFELADCSLRDPFEARFERAWAGWERFGADEPELRNALSADCARGLSERHDDGSGAAVAASS